MTIASQIKSYLPYRVRARLGALRRSLSSDPRDELLRLLPKNSIGAEIGVWKGEFSARILNIVRPKELHLIDPWKFEAGEQYENAYYGAGSRGQGGQSGMDRVYEDVVAKFAGQPSVRIHRKPSTDVDLPDNYLDWAYIDGNHLYEFVKADIAFYTRKVKPGGFILGDDYMDTDWWKDGVKRAVDEASASGPLVLRSITATQYVFRKPA